MGKISVCIATYNGEKFIYDQLQSILDQLLENDEIIVSDNYSTDKTIDIIKSINDSRIKIYFLKKKKISLGEATNLVVSQSLFYQIGLVLIGTVAIIINYFLNLPIMGLIMILR